MPAEQRPTSATLEAVNNATRQIDEIVIGQRASTDQIEATLAAATQRLLRLAEEGWQRRQPRLRPG